MTDEATWGLREGIAPRWLRGRLNTPAGGQHREQRWLYAAAGNLMKAAPVAERERSRVLPSCLRHRRQEAGDHGEDDNAPIHLNEASRQSVDDLR